MRGCQPQAVCVERTMQELYVHRLAAEMLWMAGTLPVPLIRSLFVWNMSPLNLTSSSTEGEKKSILIIILTGLSPGPLSLECVYICISGFFLFPSSP